MVRIQADENAVYPTVYPAHELYLMPPVHPRLFG